MAPRPKAIYNSTTGLVFNGKYNDVASLNSNTGQIFTKGKYATGVAGKIDGVFRYVSVEELNNVPAGFTHYYFAHSDNA